MLPSLLLHPAGGGRKTEREKNKRMKEERMNECKKVCTNKQF
jgi:hypothetical protein